MITFEEFLKGVPNNPIIEEAQEFLEEAYTPEMKQLISKEELSKIGNFLNKRFNLSVQDTKFYQWKNLDTQHLKYAEFAIVVMTDNSVKIVKKSGNSLEIVYPNSYGTLTAKDMKHVKAAFGLDMHRYGENANYTGSLKNQRERAKPGEDILLKKSQRLQKKIEYSKNKAIEDLKTLCAKYNLNIRHAYAEEDGCWSIRVENSSKLGDISLNYNTLYSRNPRAEISFGGKLITSINDFKEYVNMMDDFKKFLEELEKLSQNFNSLPIR